MKTVKGEMARERRLAGTDSGTGAKRDGPSGGFESEAPEAQASLVRMFPYLRDKHPEIVSGLVEEGLLDG